MSRPLRPSSAAVSRLAGPPVPAALILLGIVLVATNLRAAITSVGPVLDDIARDLDIDAVTSSVLISVPLIAFAACSPVAPAVARRFGIEPTLGAMLLLLAVAIAARSLPIPGLLWVGTALLGAAIAFINVLLPALIKRDFPERIGAVTGLYSSTTAVFAALAAGIAVPVANVSPAGWRVSLGMWAGLALLALLVFLPQLRRRAPSAELSVLPALGGGRGRSPWTTALGWQVTAFMGLQSTVYFTLVAWWPTIDRENGIAAGAAGWHQFALQITGIAGSLVAGALLSRMRDQRAVIAGGAGLGFLGVGGELLMPELALLWAIVVGVGGGATIVTALSLFGLRTGSPEQAAALSGMAQSVGYTMAACGPIVLGLLHEVTGEWKTPLGVLLGVIAAQFAVGMFAGRARQLPE